MYSIFFLSCSGSDFFPEFEQKGKKAPEVDSLCEIPCDVDRGEAIAARAILCDLMFSAFRRGTGNRIRSTGADSTDRTFTLGRERGRVKKGIFTKGAKLFFKEIIFFRGRLYVSFTPYASPLHTKNFIFSM